LRGRKYVKPKGKDASGENVYVGALRIRTNRRKHLWFRHGDKKKSPSASENRGKGKFGDCWNRVDQKKEDLLRKGKSVKEVAEGGRNSREDGGKSPR